MLKKLAVLALLFYVTNAHAQTDVVDTSVYQPAITHAISVYHNFRGDESNLYKGPAIQPYPTGTNGSPWFGTGDWSIGDVQYDDVRYNNAVLRYDLVKDLLAVQNPDNKTAFYLFKPRVRFFTLGNHLFVNIAKASNETAPPEGFYEQLCSGPITLFARYTKSFQENMGLTSLEQRYDEKEHFYALKDGVYHPVANVKALYALTGNFKSQIKKELRKQHIRPHRNLALALTAIAENYNHLSH